MSNKYKGDPGTRDYDGKSRTDRGGFHKRWRGKSNWWLRQEKKRLEATRRGDPTGKLIVIRNILRRRNHNAARK